MRNNEAALQDPSPFTGNSSVLVGSKASLPITHTSSLPFTLGSCQFKLNNFFYAPSFKKCFLSASQFTKDNFVIVTIHPFGQVIYDFYIDSPLFQGHCEVHLYPMSSSHT